MSLSKRTQITDKMELAEYDHLVGLCEEYKPQGGGSSYFLSLQNLVQIRFDAYRRVSEYDVPPSFLVVNAALCPWSELRTKFSRAAEAYQEVLEHYWPHR